MKWQRFSGSRRIQNLDCPGLSLEEANDIPWPVYYRRNYEDTDLMILRLKAFIVSLSQKEQTFPVEFLDKIERYFASVEEETGALLSRPKQDRLAFVGSEDRIAKALSLVENFSNSNSVNMHDLGTLWSTSKTRADNSLSLHSEDDTAAVTDVMTDRDQATFMPLRTMQSHDYSRTTLLGGTGCTAMTTGDRESSERTSSDKENTMPETVKRDNNVDNDSNSQIHKHMVKLGYRTEEVRAVLDKLGSNASMDKVLSILVSRANSSDPRIFLPDQGEDDGTGSEQEEEIDVNDSSNLRPIMIDGSNVAMSYGRNQHFDCNGIKIVVDYFLKRGHEKVFAFVPQFRKEKNRTEPTIGQEILTNLEQQGHLKFTPSRRIGTKRIVSYDDRYVLDAACEMGGIVVSNDHFRDFLEEESSKYKKVIEEQLLMYTFVEDLFMPTQDPLGKHGPHLDEFLRKKPLKQKPQSTCPYGSRCTFGDRCKYHHPERRKGSRTVSQKLNDLAQVNLRDSSDGGKCRTEPLPGYNAQSHAPSTLLQDTSASSANLEKKSWTSPLPNYQPPGVSSMRHNFHTTSYQNTAFPLSDGPRDATDLHNQMAQMSLDKSSSSTGLPSSFPPRMSSTNSPLNTGHLSRYNSRLPYQASPIGTPRHSSPYSSPNSTGMLQSPQESTFTTRLSEGLYSGNLENTSLVSRGPQGSAMFPSPHQIHPSHPNPSKQNFTSSSIHQLNQFHYPVSSHHIQNSSPYQGGLNTYPLTDAPGQRAAHLPQRSISLQENEVLRIREQIYQNLIRYYAKELVRSVMYMHPQETNIKNLELYIRQAMAQERFGL